MDDLISYDAILFPADGRPPQVVELPTRYLIPSIGLLQSLIIISEQAR